MGEENGMKRNLDGDIVIDAKHHPRGYVCEILCTLLAERLGALPDPITPNDVNQVIAAYERGERPKSLTGEGP